MSCQEPTAEEGDKRFPLLSALQWRKTPLTPSELPAEPGVYQLYLRLPHPATLAIGRLGIYDFPAGCYCYTGSALGGLRGRLARHLRSEKRHHWHIDTLLDHAVIEAITTLVTRERLECALHRETMERLRGTIIASGFGSSDCSCSSHLLVFEESTSVSSATAG